MKAKWEYSGTAEAVNEDHIYGDGWEPFAVTAIGVHYRRLVVAKCEVGHGADFNDKHCYHQNLVSGDGRSMSDVYRDCGKPIVAVPVDPFDVVGLSPRAED